AQGSRQGHGARALGVAEGAGVGYRRALEHGEGGPARDNPWRVALELEGADVRDADATEAALIRARRPGGRALVDGRATGVQGQGRGRAAVVLQRAEIGIVCADDGTGEAALVADQVAAAEGDVDPRTDYPAGEVLDGVVELPEDGIVDE